MTNTYVHTKPCHGVSWRYPRSHHWHELDLIITRRAALNSLITRSNHSAGCDTDYSLACSNHSADCGTDYSLAGSNHSADCDTDYSLAGSYHSADSDTDHSLACSNHSADCDTDHSLACSNHSADCDTDHSLAGSNHSADCDTDHSLAGSYHSADCDTDYSLAGSYHSADSDTDHSLACSNHSADCDTDYSLACSNHSADCDTDYSLACSKVQPRKLHHSKRKGRPELTPAALLKLKGSSISVTPWTKHFQTTTPKTIYNNALTACGRRERRNADWFEACWVEMEPVTAAEWKTLINYKQVPSRQNLNALRAAKSPTDCSTLGQRIQEHYLELYATENVVTDAALSSTLDVSIVEALDIEPTIEEAIDCLASSKGPGSDGIPPEVIKSGK